MVLVRFRNAYRCRPMSNSLTIFWHELYREYVKCGEENCKTPSSSTLRRILTLCQSSGMKLLQLCVVFDLLSRWPRWMRSALRLRDSAHYVKDFRLWKQTFEGLTYQFIFCVSKWYILRNKTIAKSVYFINKCFLRAFEIKMPLDNKSRKNNRNICCTLTSSLDNETHFIFETNSRMP
jgi:hypothetical protein